MSLTSYLTDTGHPDIRQKFRDEFLRPVLHLDNDIKAPPLTKNYGIIGMAFDYILRFTIQHHNKDKQIHGGPWVADFSYKRLENAFRGIEQSLSTICSYHALQNLGIFAKNCWIPRVLFRLNKICYGANCIAPDQLKF